MRAFLRNSTIWVAAILSLSTVLSPAAWPEFRGPAGDGHAPAAKGLPTTWSETENIAWKTEIPHLGWSHTRFNEWLDLADNGHTRGKRFFSRCTWTNGLARCCSTKRFFHCDKPEPLGKQHELLRDLLRRPSKRTGYMCISVSYGTACLDSRTGKVIWQRDDMPCRHYRGPSSSPVLFGDTVILTFDGAGPAVSHRFG